MYLLGVGVTVLGLTSQARAIPHERDQAPTYQSNATRANAVKQAFQIAWDGYYTYAFPMDSLQPISYSGYNDRNGWGASAVDAFSTALIMGKWHVVEQILNYVPTIDFDNTADAISLFETTIRYLGGLISAYDLLTGPLKGRSNSTISPDAVLNQAKRLANNLAFAFNTPSGIPHNNIYFSPSRFSNDTSNGIATIGTLVLEWTRLSDITGNATYGQLAQKAESYLLKPQPAALAEPFPGLIGTSVNLTNGQFLDGDGGWTGGTDSFYEYLIKMYLYDPNRFELYKDRWVLAVNSSIKYLASHPSTRPDLTFLAIHRNKTLVFASQHLACFDGGNFILGGLAIDAKEYVDFGLELVEGCHDTYTATATRIGPEIFRWQDSKLPLIAANNKPPPEDQLIFYERAGYWIDNAGYDLRPEVMESYYHAYRATGNPKYQEWAWDAFLAINRTTRGGGGYSNVDNVNAPDGGEFGDFQETFFFAELLKYSYLIFAEDAPWQIKADHTNEFVFNTEAHPVRIFGGSEKVKRNY